MKKMLAVVLTAAMGCSILSGCSGGGSTGGGAQQAAQGSNEENSSGGEDAPVLQFSGGMHWKTNILRL